METNNNNTGIHILGGSGVYSLFGKNGAMEHLKRVKLDKGVKLYAYGAAMSLQYFVIYDNNMNAVEICGEGKDPNKVDKYDLDGYFGCFVKATETTRSIKEKFGIGLYYAEGEPLISDDIIKRSLLRAENIKKLEKELKERKVKEEEEQRNLLLKKYNYLQLLKEPFDHKTTGANIRTELNKNFPGVKFSVRYESFSGNNAYNITWNDGPKVCDVDNVVKKYADMHPDTYSCGDYWDCNPSIFNSLFGSVGYISTNRNITELTKESIKKEILERFPDVNDDNLKNYPFCDEEYYKASVYSDCINDFIYYLARSRDLTTKAVNKEDAKTQNGGYFKIVDYSEKAIALTGDTKQIKDQLKALGGRFNMRLSCGAGWVFSKKKESELRALLGL